eukprot:2529818-Rhodomonas_salina.2
MSVPHSVGRQKAACPMSVPCLWQYCASCTASTIRCASTAHSVSGGRIGGATVSVPDIAEGYTVSTAMALRARSKIHHQYRTWRREGVVRAEGVRRQRAGTVSRARLLASGDRLDAPRPLVAPHTASVPDTA